MKSNAPLDPLGTALQTQWDSFHAFASIGLETLGRLMTHNLNSVNGLLEDMTTELGKLTPLESLAALPERQNRQLEKSRAWWHELFEILARSQDEIRTETTRSFGVDNQAMSSLLDGWRQASPAGGLAADTFRSVFAAASQAFDRMGRAALQVAEITESGMEAAAEATARAIAKAEEEEPRKAA